MKLVEQRPTAGVNEHAFGIGGAEVELLPEIGERIAVGVGAAGGQRRGVCWDGERRRGGHRRALLPVVVSVPQLASAGVGGERQHLIEAAAMEVVFAVGLRVVVPQMPA